MKKTDEEVKLEQIASVVSDAVEGLMTTKAAILKIELIIVR